MPNYTSIREATPRNLVRDMKFLTGKAIGSLRRKMHLSGTSGVGSRSMSYTEAKTFLKALSGDQRRRLKERRLAARSDSNIVLSDTGGILQPQARFHKWLESQGDGHGEFTQEE